MAISDLLNEHAIIKSTAAILGWDQEIYLPTAAAEYRAKQLSWLAAQAHALATSDKWLRDLEAAESSDSRENFRYTASLREIRREYMRAIKLPVELVAESSSVTSAAMHAWAGARENSDFTTFAPHLEKQISLSREMADLWGYADEPYDALLEGYERGISTAEIIGCFEKLAPELSHISAVAVAKCDSSSPRLLNGNFPVQDQVHFNALVAEDIGFDFKAGRIDTTSHPFCTTLGPRDVRITTRYDNNDFTSSLFGVLHEAGHGLYEQGLVAEDYGLPSGSSVSLGIHESQSRLWENHVGRSLAFWEKWYPSAQETFADLRNFSFTDFIAHMRRASFSPIRVEADEATYDLHILLRFGLERRLLNGSLSVADVPAAWNEEFYRLFGFTPPDDAAGCLQDIHWAMGGFGYFPTYTLGNLNAAQLFSAAQSESVVAAANAKADYGPLLSWLRKNVHQHGAAYSPAHLIQCATGRPPESAAYLAHLKARYL